MRRKKKSGSFSSARNPRTTLHDILLRHLACQLYILSCLFPPSHREISPSKSYCSCRMASGELTIKMESSSISFLYALILHSQIYFYFSSELYTLGRIRDILSSLSNCSKAGTMTEQDTRLISSPALLFRVVGLILLCVSTTVVQFFFVILRRTILYFVFFYFGCVTIPILFMDKSVSCFGCFYFSSVCTSPLFLPVSSQNDLCIVLLCCRVLSLQESAESFLPPKHHEF